jgi:hypothetical protein
MRKYQLPNHLLLRFEVIATLTGHKSGFAARDKDGIIYTVITYKYTNF